MIEGDISSDIDIISEIMYFIIQRRLLQWVHLTQSKILLRWSMKY
jgi:hypothetical protein